SDHHRGDHRLCAGRAPASGAAAAAVDRLHLADRLCADGAGLEPSRLYGGARRACDVQAASGDRLRAVSADGGATLPGQPYHRMNHMPETPTRSAVTSATETPARAAAGPWPEPFRAQHMAVSGGTQYVRLGGKGPAVLLLHGFGDTGDMWVLLAE